MWTTTQLMLILECLIDLKSKQGDVKGAFLHAHLPQEETVCVHMPRGFSPYSKKEGAKVLKLRICLYGLKNSPRKFWKFTVEKLEVCGTKQSKLDPCLFVADKVMSVMHADNLVMWPADDQHIIDIRNELHEVGVNLEEENDVAGFL